VNLNGWVRIVNYQFSHTPLSCAGSLKYIGGRYNAGVELEPNTLAAWPTLYIAENYETAFREAFQLCQQQLNTNTGLKKQRLNTDTPNVFHFCPAGLVQ
jgi:RES domain-containing protein